MIAIVSYCIYLYLYTYIPLHDFHRRYGAAGIVLVKSFKIFGGYDGSVKFSSTEIITEEGQVSPGPGMPTGVYHHAIAGVNATTSILTGGSIGTGQSAKPYSPLTWYFNHVSQEFQPGPSLITGRRHHASGTIQDQDTKKDIVAVVGGKREGIALDSTEFLINGEWTPGK